MAFLEPEHSNSHFHMTCNGIRHILEYGGFEVLNIEATKGWNVITSMNLLFTPKIFRKIRSVLYFSMRRLIIKSTLLFSSKEVQTRRTKYLADDDLRHAGSIIFLAKKLLTK